MNAWLTEGAVRSLGAVYDHIPAAEPDEVKRQLLTVVAGRLLQGYAVDEIDFTGGDVRIRMKPDAIAPDWYVKISQPNLSPPVDTWFAEDVRGLSGEIARLMVGVPMEAVLWGDLDLKRHIEAMCADRLPGWRVSLMVRGGALGDVSLEVLFMPEQPLTLAVSSRINSLSIPVMLHSSLREDLLKGFAPVIGIPVLWLEKHKDDFVALAKDILAEEALVEQAKAVPEIRAVPGSVSDLEIDLESRRYAAWVWMAVYAGSEYKYPEAGLHFGRKVVPLSGWDMEMYTELILSLGDWDLEARLGARWSPWRYFWVGGEWSSDEHLWWARFMLEPVRRKPYAWARISEMGDLNGGVGLRLTDFVSLELYYDDRDEDAWNVKAIVNM